MTRPKIIVVAEFVGDVVVVSPRTFDRVVGLNAREALIDQRLMVHPKYQEIMNAITPCFSQSAEARFLAIAAKYPIDAELLDRARRHNGGYLPLGHLFIGVAGHPDDDECTYRANGTDETYCGEPEANHDPHDSHADGLDDCPACDAPLASCSRSNVCCADCTHAANWPPRRTKEEV
ncbi:MAG: hypothetical protein ACOH14_06315 [Rhodoglobus sp.]